MSSYDVSGAVLDTWKAAFLHSSNASPCHLTGIENMWSVPLPILKMNAGARREYRRETEIVQNNHIKLKMKLK